MSEDKVDNPSPRRETVIKIPLAALNKLRITCEYCGGAMELSLSKSVIQKMKDQNVLCMYCGKSQHSPKTDLSLIDTFWGNIERLLSFQALPGASVEFIIRVEPPEFLTTK